MGEGEKQVQITCETLAESHKLSAFDCGDTDLNDFIKDDAQKHQSSCMAVTSVALLEDQEDVVGYFSLASDCITLDVKEKERIYTQYGISYNEYPALKICRLAVRGDSQRIGIGIALIKHVVYIAEELQDTIGLRFISVDAYKRSIGFYSTQGFLRNTHESERKGSTVSMRFELSNRVFDEALYDRDVPLPLA